MRHIIPDPSVFEETLERATPDTQQLVLLLMLQTDLVKSLKYSAALPKVDKHP
jgi:hypothetical protein